MRNSPLLTACLFIWDKVQNGDGELVVTKSFWIILLYRIYDSVIFFLPSLEKENNKMFIQSMHFCA